MDQLLSPNIPQVFKRYIEIRYQRQRFNEYSKGWVTTKHSFISDASRAISDFALDVALVNTKKKRQKKRMLGSDPRGRFRTCNWSQISVTIMCPFPLDGNNNGKLKF